ncbi:Alpha beta-hydrolase [Mycena sanguinolenta]|uniref:Alpha beta-hydrolase n=1 Tax=Mycena sanguinolenta TaxID=230812 RepID=A0A8H7DJU0_9AGAR|nr:Alpha beta-hydrolase [Mycena sanguinolenta]
MSSLRLAQLLSRKWPTISRATPFSPGFSLSERSLVSVTAPAQACWVSALLPTVHNHPSMALSLRPCSSSSRGNFPPISAAPSARDVDPLRWGTLEPGYITTNTTRATFYPPDPTSFSPRMLIFDDFTKDVGTVGTFYQVFTTTLTTNYTGPVAKVIGSEDQVFCVGSGRCVDVAALTAAERALWPSAKSFEVVVAQGSGHSMNLDFFAQGPFNTFVHFVNQFTGPLYG